MYTSIAPSQITLDPSFVAAPGQPDISAVHEVPNPASSQPLACPSSLLTIAGIIGAGGLVIAFVVLLFVLIRRKNTPKGTA